MSRECADESTDPLVGRLGVEIERTARAARISRSAVKSSCACEWGGWGQLSDDGPGQHNLDRSEGPWGRAEELLARRCTSAPRSSTQIEEAMLQAAECTKDGGKPPDAITTQSVGRHCLPYRP
jgi:hypothetical protein